MGKSIVSVVVLLALSLVHQSVQQQTIPGFTPSSSDAACNITGGGSALVYVTNFLYGYSYWSSSDGGSADRDSDTFDTSPINATDWNNFKAGWAATGYHLQDNFYNCTHFIPTVSGQTNETQKLMCEYTRRVALAGLFCDNLREKTTEFNKGLDPVIPPCSSTLGKRICLALQPYVSELVNNAATTRSALPYTYDRYAITVPTCNPSDCTAVGEKSGTAGI